MGCTVIEIHGADRVDMIRQAGIAWVFHVQASEPLLIDRTSYGFDASRHDFVLGFRRSRSVYRSLSSDCQALIVVESRSDAEEAINLLARSLGSGAGSVCVLRN